MRQCLGISQRPVLVILLLISITCSAGAIFTPSTMLNEFIPTNGPIEDVLCNVEDLEQANDSQLYTILHELKQTNFFRHFVVDLAHKCPLRSLGGDDSLELEEEFECSGGKEELDEDAEPLCTVQAGGDDPFAFDSNALFSISKEGFESKEQKDTFQWKQHSDMVVIDKEGEPCEDDKILPDSFWLDLCSNIKAGDGTNVVNLLLNPEHNTGYNGTHIWRAIYEENCIVVDGDQTEMCFEERVLYRLLSGLHTSTTLSISKFYYPPSKRKGRADWEPNPQYFMEKFEKHPEHIRNLHFSYVVLLRALRKATAYLKAYEIRTGVVVDDETATVLLNRLLDTAILRTCSSVFEAFDESVMFHDSNKDVVSLQQNFKGVFHNISSILDCVQCQQCKLHGKMAMMGYGTALKILFVNSDNLELERNEIVAFINTVAKISESVRQVRELTHLYWNQQQEVRKASARIASQVHTKSSEVVNSLDLVDAAVGLFASLGRNAKISFDREKELVKLAFERNPDLLTLVKYYATEEEKFLEMARFVGTLGDQPAESAPDAIVVGSGLAGLVATLNILDRGGRVVLIEKEHLLGGNSNKASSGINACCQEEEGHDSIDLFRNDTVRSAGLSARLDLIETLVTKSADAVSWLKERAGVDLSLLAQLGGHSSKRTHRPVNGMVGAEVIYGIQKAVRKYEETGQVRILVDTKVTRILKDDNGSVVGVEYVNVKDGGEPKELHSQSTILATGGFAADRSQDSLMARYRPEYLRMPTTAGAFSTGDGIRLASSLGAGSVDMDKIQIHPTGWVDPADPENTSKILAAELMRGVGGILLNNKGERFCNELGTRAYVTGQMLMHDPHYAKTGQWDINATIPDFFLVLSSSAARDAEKHVNLYTHKGLMTRIEGLSQLEEWSGISKKTLESSLKQYRYDASMGIDSFGKTTFRGVPGEDLESETFYVGKTTPVAHYCMGGITIDTEGHVLNERGEIIPGLFAAGEVTGGVHGENRLAGNSLLECTVYGTIVGNTVPIERHAQITAVSHGANALKEKTNEVELQPVSLSELQKHNTSEDCWVAIHGIVYDLTSFADEHPAGAESIIRLAGTDGTDAFSAVHNVGILDEFEDDKVGILAFSQ